MYFLILSFIVMTFFAWLFYKYNEIKIKFKSIDHIVGPKPLPILGNVFDFGFNPVDKIKNVNRLVNMYGPLTKAWIGPTRFYLIVTDPEFCEVILSSPKYIKKSQDYDILKPWLGNGLLASSGSYWQNRRKIITPAFHFKILEDFVNIFNTETKILIQRLSKTVEETTCDICPYIKACTLDIICESAMGTSVKAQSSIENEYVKAVNTICYIIIERAFSSWKQIDALFKYSRSYKTQQDALKIIHGFTKSVISKRRNKLISSNNKLSENVNDLGIKKKMAFLDVLLNANINGQPLTDEDIREEVDTFMFEGHDTTASLISFTMYELAKNQDVQKKMFDELRQIYGDDKNYDPSLENLNNMKYTELVLKEALRLYPTAPYLARTLEEDVNYKGTVFPKDLRIFIFIYGMHRKADLFPDPDKFNPDRFISKTVGNNPFSYIPFSAGPRNCIGQKYAMYEAKCLISKIIMNFEILPADSKFDIILSGEVILKSANGVYVKLKHRQF